MSGLFSNLLALHNCGAWGPGPGLQAYKQQQQQHEIVSIRSKMEHVFIFVLCFGCLPRIALLCLGPRLISSRGLCCRRRRRRGLTVSEQRRPVQKIEKFAFSPDALMHCYTSVHFFYVSIQPPDELIQCIVLVCQTVSVVLH